MPTYEIIGLVLLAAVLAPLITYLIWKYAGRVTGHATNLDHLSNVHIAIPLGAEVFAIICLSALWYLFPKFFWETGLLNWMMVLLAIAMVAFFFSYKKGAGVALAIFLAAFGLAKLIQVWSSIPSTRVAVERPFYMQPASPICNWENHLLTVQGRQRVVINPGAKCIVDLKVDTNTKVDLINNAGEKWTVGPEGGGMRPNFWTIAVQSHDGSTVNLHYRLRTGS